MDAYSGYNEIRMNPLDALKTAFMTNAKNYHYEVTSFGLRNAGATFQRSMDSMFAVQIGRNLEVYIDDLMVKTPENAAHTTDWTRSSNKLGNSTCTSTPPSARLGSRQGNSSGSYSAVEE